MNLVNTHKLMRLYNYGGFNSLGPIEDIFDPSWCLHKLMGIYNYGGLILGVIL